MLKKLVKADLDCVPGSDRELLRSFRDDLVPVGKLKVRWIEAQRPFSPRKAKGIADKFNWELLGEVVVSGPFADDGLYHIIDGQHRSWSVDSVFGRLETVPCRVYPEMSQARAAWLFRELNSNRTKPLAIDMFRTAVTAGNEPESSIARIAKEAGYGIGNSSLNNIPGVRTLDIVYRADGDGALLKRALLAIRETWGRGAPGATDAIVIRAFAEFLRRHPEVVRKRMHQVVAKKFTPSRFVGQARTASKINDLAAHEAGTEILVRTYDQGLSTGRLVPHRKG